MESPEDPELLDHEVKQTALKKQIRSLVKIIERQNEQYSK